MKQEIVIMTGTVKQVQEKLDEYCTSNSVIILGFNGTTDDFIMTVELLPKKYEN